MHQHVTGTFYCRNVTSFSKWSKALKNQCIQSQPGGWTINIYIIYPYTTLSTTQNNKLTHTHTDKQVIPTPTGQPTLFGKRLHILSQTRNPLKPWRTVCSKWGWNFGEEKKNGNTAGGVEAPVSRERERLTLNCESAPGKIPWRCGSRGHRVGTETETGSFDWSPSKTKTFFWESLRTRGTCP